MFDAVFNFDEVIVDLLQRLANIVTVSECKHIRVSGRYNEDNTWFPSYYWAAISCRRYRYYYCSNNYCSNN